MNLADRIDISCRHSGISQVGIAKSLGVTKGTVSAFKLGRSTIHNGFERISKILQVPQEWLEHGTGPAPAWFQAPESILPAPPDQAQIQLKMLAAIESLTKEMQETKQLLAAHVNGFKQPEKTESPPLIKRRDIPIRKAPEPVTVESGA